MYFINLNFNFVNLLIFLSQMYINTESRHVSLSRICISEIPVYVFASYRNGIENGLEIDVIKFSDKNGWRQGKIAVGFPEFLCKLPHLPFLMYFFHYVMYN